MSIKALKISSAITCLLLTGCSGMFNPCKSGDAINDVKQIVSENLPSMAGLMCENDEHCKIKIEIKKVTLEDKNDFITECSAVGRAVVKVSDESIIGSEELKAYSLGSSILDVSYSISKDDNGDVNVKAATSVVDATIDRNFMSDMLEEAYKGIK